MICEKIDLLGWRSRSDEGFATLRMSPETPLRMFVQLTGQASTASMSPSVAGCAVDEDANVKLREQTKVVTVLRRQRHGCAGMGRRRGEAAC